VPQRVLAVLVLQVQLTALGIPHQDPATLQMTHKDTLTVKGGSMVRLCPDASTCNCPIFNKLQLSVHQCLSVYFGAQDRHYPKLP
jgi:hypothetical protein